MKIIRLMMLKETVMLVVMNLTMVVIMVTLMDPLQMIKIVLMVTIMILSKEMQAGILQF